MTKDVLFPRFMWHPTTGERRMFAKAEDLIEGWLDFHPHDADKAPAAPASPASGNATRDMLMAALTAAQIQVPADATDEQVQATFREAAVSNLQSRNVAIPKNASVQQLYDLVMA